MQLENLTHSYIERFNMEAFELAEVIENTNSNFFLLIDSAKNHLFFKKWLNSLTRQQLLRIGNLFEGTIDESSPLEVSPLLLQLDSENVKLLFERFLNEENKGLFSLIQTDLSKQVVIKHLQPYLEAQMPNGELALFRFYDPSIIKILNKMLSNKDYNNLLEPIENWWHQSLDGSFQNITIES